MVTLSVVGGGCRPAVTQLTKPTLASSASGLGQAVRTMGRSSGPLLATTTGPPIPTPSSCMAVGWSKTTELW